MTGSLSWFAIVGGVADPLELVDELFVAVASLNTNIFTKIGLTIRLLAVKRNLAEGDHSAALDSLNDFTSSVEAQRGRRISDEDADNLISQAAVLADVVMYASADAGAGDAECRGAEVAEDQHVVE